MASLRLCVLLGKHSIWQCRYDERTGNVSSFFVTLTRYLASEKYNIAVCKGKLEQFATIFGMSSLVDIIEIEDILMLGRVKIHVTENCLGTIADLRSLSLLHISYFVY